MMDGAICWPRIIILLGVRRKRTYSQSVPFMKEVAERPENQLSGECELVKDHQRQESFDLPYSTLFF